jgi:hypothetical protein
MSSTEPGHTNDEHTTMDGNPDRRFKEVSLLPSLSSVLLAFVMPSESSFLITDVQNGGGQHGNQGGRETGFEEIGDGSSSLVTEGTGEDTGTYKYVFVLSILYICPLPLPYTRLLRILKVEESS